MARTGCSRLAMHTKNRSDGPAMTMRFGPLPQVTAPRPWGEEIDPAVKERYIAEGLHTRACPNHSTSQTLCSPPRCRSAPWSERAWLLRVKGLSFFPQVSYESCRSRAELKMDVWATQNRII